MGILHALSMRTRIMTVALVLCAAGVFLIPHSSLLDQREKYVVEEIQRHLLTLESNVSSTLLDRQFFKDLLDVIQGKGAVTNEVIQKMKSLANEPYTIYLYQEDSLLYWSKPGRIIDPDFIANRKMPIVASDHISDYLIKEYMLYHDFESFRAFAKIPILHDQTDRNLLRIVSDPDYVRQQEHWQQVESQEGVPVCTVQFLREKLGFWQQFLLLILSLTAGGLFVVVVPRLMRSLAPRAYAVLGAGWPIAALCLLRGLSFLGNYHQIFDELALLQPIHEGRFIIYSLGDFMLDAALFTIVAVLITRRVRFVDEELTTQLERNITSIATYLLLILMFGLLAWVQRWLVMHTSLSLNLEQISFVSPQNAAVFTGLGAIIFSIFLLSHHVLKGIPKIQPSIYRRTVDLIVASLLSLVCISMLNLNLPFFGFYVAVLSMLVLFDLFNESRARSVIWVICWSMLLAGFEASLLHKYQQDKDMKERVEMAQDITRDLSSRPDIEEVMLQWLPNIPSHYSVGIFRGRRLAYNYNYPYPLVLPNGHQTTGMYRFLTADRTEFGYTTGDITVTIGKRNIGLMQVVSLFSYIFALFNVLLFFIALANSYFHFLPADLDLSFSSKPTLRNRIQVAIVFLIILSFVIIGFVTVFYLRNTSQDRDKRYFEDRLRAIATSITQAVPSADSMAHRKTLIPRVAGIAYVYNRQAKIYDESGNLILQSDNRPGQISRGPIKMSFVSKFEMDQSKRMYSIEEKSHGINPAYHGLLALRDEENTHYGYIELPAIAMVQSAGDAGSRFFGTLLNAYVFLFLIAVALAIGVANSITRPLAELGEKLKQLRIGKKNEPIQWGIDDEIGALINDYNSMIQKLDESAYLLALTERDTAWREMAKQVAHEIKNPLTPMKLSIQYLQNGLNSDPASLKKLVKRVSQTLIEQIDNLSTIASEFSNFAKMPQADNEKVLLNEVVASVHDLFRKREDMDVHLYVPIEDIYVFADRTQVVRVLNNVVKNAMQAIPDTKRGHIEITLQKRGDKAVIIIEDNGTGISQEMRDKVFRPNFTTKSSGTGLGLAISANIVETFNGRIYFETDPGQGTKFYVEIPLMKLDDNIREQERVML